MSVSWIRVSAIGLLLSAVAQASSLDAQAPAKWVGVVDLTIGGAAADDPYLFSLIRGLAFDPQGRIFVADARENEVKAFSPLGSHLFTYGRRGEGPGDLSEPCCLSFAPDGKLWVGEFGNNRYSVLDLNGNRARFLYSVRRPPTAYTARSTDPLQFDGSGHAIDIALLRVADRSGFGYIRSVLDSSGRVRKTDTIPPAPNDSVSAIFRVENKVNGKVVSRDNRVQDFGPQQLRAFGTRGEVATAVSSRYAVTWSDSSGRRIVLVQRAGAGPLLGPKEKAGAERNYESMSKASGSKPPFGVVERKPILTELGFDLDGRLWIRRTGPEGATMAEADVYDRTGRQVATVSWDAKIQLLGWAIRGRTALGVSMDKEGIQQVVRLQFK